jgi:MFS transporter, DHA1 family, multidrug resistance protein
MLVAIGLATILGVLTLPESLPPERREHGSLWASIAGYADFLGNGQLLGYSAAIGFFYAGVFANIAGGPFAYIDYFGVSPSVYALIFAGSVFGLMLTNMINARFVLRLGTGRMLRLGTMGAALFGLTTALVTATGWGGVIGLVIAQLLFTAMNGLILANGVAAALASVTTRTGSAAAVIGAIQYGSGMVGAALVGLLADGTPAPMGVIMAIAGLGSVLCAAFAGRHRQG